MKQTPRSLAIWTGAPVAALALAAATAWFLLPRLAPEWTIRHSPFRWQLVEAALRADLVTIKLSRDLRNRLLDVGYLGFEQELLPFLTTSDVRAVNALSLLLACDDAAPTGWRPELQPVLALAQGQGDSDPAAIHAARQVLRSLCRSGDFLVKQQTQDGLWNGSVRDTALVLLALSKDGELHRARRDLTAPTLALLTRLESAAKPAPGLALAALVAGVRNQVRIPDLQQRLLAVQPSAPSADPAWSLDEWEHLLGLFLIAANGELRAADRTPWRAKAAPLFAIFHAGPEAAISDRLISHPLQAGRDALLLGSVLLLQTDKEPWTAWSPRLMEAIRTLHAGPDPALLPAVFTAMLADRDAYCRNFGSTPDGVPVDRLCWDGPPALLGSVGAADAPMDERIRHTALALLVGTMSVPSYFPY